MVKLHVNVKSVCLMFLVSVLFYSLDIMANTEADFKTDVIAAYKKNFPDAKRNITRAGTLVTRIVNDHNSGSMSKKNRWFLFVGHKTSDGNFATVGTPNVEMNYCEWYAQDGSWRHPAGLVPKIGERYGAWFRYQYSKSKKEWRGAMMCAGGWNADHRKGSDTGDSS
jgi:hypothetical protein